MTSSITNNFRSVLLEKLKDDIENGTANYYIGIARGENYTEPSDVSSIQYQSQVRSTLQSVKTASNVSFVIPTVSWSSGTIYNAYDDNDFDQSNFYIVNSNREVFLCVEQAISDTGVALQSTTEPTSVLAGTNQATFSTADGYKWRYMYKVSSLAYTNFRTLTYTPVKKITATSFIPEEIEQDQFQKNTVSGEIIGIAIDSAGTGYDSAGVTLTIEGNGSGASFSASIYQGSIVKVQVDSDGLGSYSHGSGYDYASVKLSSGDAVLRPIIGPKEGTHADPVQTLKSKALMVQTSFQADENSSILAKNDFRNVTLIRNLSKYGSDSDFTANTGNALHSMDITVTVGSVFDEDNDEIISNTSGTASAKVFHHDTTNNILYYYQDNETGFAPFSTSQTITGEISNTSATIDAFNTPDVDAYSGEILYINNVDAVDRADNQTEDIRIVIQLG